MRKPRALFMAIDPESFDEPVKDYDFASLGDASSLIDQMATAGGFTATKLAYARDILKDMKAEIDEVDGDAGKVTNWLSFPACLCATGTRGFFVEAVKRKKPKEAMFMGLGDVIFPGMLVISCVNYISESGLAVGISALIGGLVGYIVLMTYVASGRPQAGLPLLNGGAILGYIIGGLIFVGSAAFSFGITL